MVLRRSYDPARGLGRCERVTFMNFRMLLANLDGAFRVTLDFFTVTSSIAIADRDIRMIGRLFPDVFSIKMNPRVNGNFSRFIDINVVGSRLPDGNVHCLPLDDDWVNNY